MGGVPAAARRTPTQPARECGGHAPNKPLGFNALALGERHGTPRPIVVHGPLHHHLTHAQGTPNVALAGAALDDPLAGPNPKSRQSGLRTGKNGQMAVEVSHLALATLERQMLVQVGRAAREQG